MVNITCRVVLDVHYIVSLRLLKFAFIVGNHEESHDCLSLLKQLLVPRLTCKLEFKLSPAEWAAILCGVGGAEQLEKLDVTMKFTNVSPSMLYIVDKLIEPWSEHSVCI